ncbi:hypothetical protein M758_9G129400 [Ceratodon purpureus]|nr:hypothetical protein M758_9G129400 [Ceratodon purpureus]
MEATRVGPCTIGGKRWNRESGSCGGRSISSTTWVIEASSSSSNVLCYLSKPHTFYPERIFVGILVSLEICMAHVLRFWLNLSRQLCDLIGLHSCSFPCFKSVKCEDSIYLTSQR